MPTVQVAEVQIDADGFRDGNNRYDDGLMLVGWDTDDDGLYPPHDGDDEAILDGGTNQLGYAIRGLTATSRWPTSPPRTTVQPTRAVVEDS